MTANKRIAETICGHSAQHIDATPRLLVCRVDMVLSTALVADNSKSRDNVKREIVLAFELRQTNLIIALLQLSCSGKEDDRDRTTCHPPSVQPLE